MNFEELRRVERKEIMKGIPWVVIPLITILGGSYLITRNYLPNAHRQVNLPASVSQYDSNGNGKLDEDELVRLAGNLDKTPYESKIQDLRKLLSMKDYLLQQYSEELPERVARHKMDQFTPSEDLAGLEYIAVADHDLDENGILDKEENERYEEYCRTLKQGYELMMDSVRDLRVSVDEHKKQKSERIKAIKQRHMIMMNPAKDIRELVDEDNKKKK